MIRNVDDLVPDGLLERIKALEDKYNALAFCSYFNLFLLLIVVVYLVLKGVGFL